MDTQFTTALQIYSGIDSTLYLQGSPYTVSYVTSGTPDFIPGSGQPYTYFGVNGNHIVFGSDGNDLIEARNGNSALYGGTGNDRLIAINAGPVVNGVSTYFGETVLDGGPGNNSFSAFTAHSTVIGGDGNDDVNVGGGVFDVNVGAGTNSVNIPSGEGHVVADSGTFNITLANLSGRTTIDVGVGGGVFNINAINALNNSQQLTINNTGPGASAYNITFGRSTVDTIHINSPVETETLNLHYGVLSNPSTHTWDWDTSSYTLPDSIQSVTLWANDLYTNPLIIYGNDLDNFIRGSPSKEIIYGGAGNDYIDTAIQFAGGHPVTHLTSSTGIREMIRSYVLGVIACMAVRAMIILPE